MTTTTIILCAIAYVAISGILYAIIERIYRTQIDGEEIAMLFAVFWPVLFLGLPLVGIAWLSYTITNYIIKKLKS